MDVGKDAKSLVMLETGIGRKRLTWSLGELISTWEVRKEKWALCGHEVGKYEHSSEAPRLKGCQLQKHFKTSVCLS